jgi:hypothetical protein
MIKRSGIFLAIATLVMSIAIWGNPLDDITAAFSSTTAPEPSANLENALANASNLNIDSEQLMAHLAAVSQPRATPDEKATARQYIIEQLTGYGLTVEQQTYQQPPNEPGRTSRADSSPSDDWHEGTNIVATLPGSDPDAGSILLGAHYDSLIDSPGADDNGSAIAALIETGRIFAQQADVLRANAAKAAPRTLKLVFFDQEESQPDGSGLLGSLAFTGQASNIADLKGAIILDMIGYACYEPNCQSYPAQIPLQNLPDIGDFIAVLGLRDHVDLLGAFMLSAQRNQPTVLSLPVPEPMLRLFPDLLRSDHAPFWEKGIPAVFVSDTANFRNPHYHTAEDTVETIDPAFFQGSAQHIVNAIAALINQSA